jgi:hypothetical protein
MAGYFELVDAPDGGYRVRMMDGTGNLMAISVTFPTEKGRRGRGGNGPGDCRHRPHQGQEPRWCRYGHQGTRASCEQPQGGRIPGPESRGCQAGCGQLMVRQESESPDSGRRRGILFDVDGTLIDSSYIHTISWWGAFRQQGYDIPMASIHHFVGMGGDRLVDSLLPDDRDKSLDSEIMASHAALYASHWPALRRFDGAKETAGPMPCGGSRRRACILRARPGPAGHEGHPGR